MISTLEKDKTSKMAAPSDFAMEKTPPVNNNNNNASVMGGESDVELTLGTFELDMPADVQAALDSLIEFYKENAVKPVVKATGTPLDICVTLVKEVRESLPESMDLQAKTVLDYIIKAIVDFCRTRQAKGLSIHFTFERESRGAPVSKAKEGWV